MALPNTQYAIKFSHVSLMFSCVSACLAAIYLIHPELMFWLFGMASQSEADVMARRSGALFLGISIMLYRIRLTDDPSVKMGVSIGLGTSCAALAVLGLCEFIVGHVKAGILLAVGTELVCAVCYLSVFHAEKRGLHQAD